MAECENLKIGNMLPDTNNIFHVPEVHDVTVIFQDGNLVILDGKRRVKSALEAHEAICVFVAGIGRCKVSKTGSGEMTGDFTGTDRIPFKDVNPVLFQSS